MTGRWHRCNDSDAVGRGVGGSESDLESDGLMFGGGAGRALPTGSHPVG